MLRFILTSTILILTGRDLILTSVDGSTDRIVLEQWSLWTFSDAQPACNLKG